MSTILKVFACRWLLDPTLTQYQRGNASHRLLLLLKLIQLNHCHQELLEHVMKDPVWTKPSSPDGLFKLSEELVWGNTPSQMSARRMYCMVAGLVPIKFPHLSVEFISDEKSIRTMMAWYDTELPSRYKCRFTTPAAMEK